EPTEAFISLLKIKHKDAQAIFDTIVKELKLKNIDLTKIRFPGFDGASVFSGEFNSVSAKFLQESLLTLTSLFNFINRSSIRLACSNDIQTLLQHTQLKLIQPVDTRWLSYSRCINAAISYSESLIITLEHITNERGEESPNASEPTLEALSILSKSIQTKNGDLIQLEQAMLGTLLRLEELKDFNVTEHKQIFEIIDKVKTLSSNNHNRICITCLTTRTNKIS
ncbi:unnamed protein product, partial [Rotaria sp. Silwood2]